MAAPHSSDSYDPNLELNPRLMQLGIAVFAILAAGVVAFILFGAR